MSEGIIRRVTCHDEVRVWGRRLGEQWKGAARITEQGLSATWLCPACRTPRRDRYQDQDRSEMGITSSLLETTNVSIRTCLAVAFSGNRLPAAFSGT
jgi:hypothetical protein